MTEADELRERMAALAAREEELERRERAMNAKALHHNLYANLTVSERTVNMVIVACVAGIAILVALGMYFGRQG
ncbi:MAG: hypothetical protein LUC93_11700 [Planctomycetaceae bacterium]|nr:hypothetical protein [Planctomycetaceae bacterium]